MAERRSSAERLVELATGEHEEFDVPVPPLAGKIKVLGIPSPAGDGRLWFQTGIVTCGDGECADPRQGMLWSFALGDERPRRELSAVHFAVHGDLLAWTEERHWSTPCTCATWPQGTSASTPSRASAPSTS